MTLPTEEEAKEFLEEADEVARLVQCLAEGTITPEYLDKKIAQKEAVKQTKPKDDDKALAAVGKPKDGGPAATQAGAAKQADADPAAEEARKEELMRKVQELKASHERKLRARVKYEEYVANGGGSGYFTDYNKWDMWCPEDEQDDLINSMTPNNPQFKAMEKDIEERHKRMVEQRQLAERQRVAGNAAFKARQYSEALRCYQLGLESERHNMALHANAAQAALKLSCFVQAVEHCDKLLHVADALHNNPKHELCVKALQRRATAYKALQQPQRAVEDLEKALEIAPADAEIQKQLGKARQELDEERKQRALRKAVAKSGGAATADANGGADGKKVVEVAGARVDVEKLRKLEKLVVRLAPADAAADPCAAASPAAPSRARELSDACDELSRLLCDDDACCVYFREVGGMQAAARQLASPEAGPGPSAPLVPPAPLLLLLNAACFNDANLDMLPALPRVLPACARLLGGADATAAAATLLCTASTREEVRKAVSKELAAGGGLASAVGLLTSGTPQVKGLVLTLLSNCAVDKPTKEGLADPLSEGPAPLRSLQQLLASPPAAVLAEKALALIGNMCNAAPLRQLLSGSRDIVTAVADMACAGGAASSTDAASSATSSSKPVVGLGASGLSAPKRAASSSSSSSSPSSFSAKLATPAATALYNLSLDPPTAEVLATSGRVADLCKALASSSSCGSGCGATLHAARLAGCLSRVAKQPEAAKQMLDAGALSLMLKLVVAAVQAKAAQPGTPVAAVSAAAGAASSSSAGGEGAAEAAPLLLDACVRAVTIFTTGSPAAVVDQLVKEGGVAALLGVLRAFGGAEGVLGNASLCLANVASQKQHLPALQVADAVAPLVKVAYEGKGNVASKNAAIALARLAQQPAMLERLRELHGVEIIYQYVKPT